MAKEEQIITPEGYVLPVGAKEITPPDSVGPVYLVPLTAEEEAERAQWAKDDETRQAAEEAKLVAKETAKVKLAKLGLTEEEISALTS